MIEDDLFAIVDAALGPFGSTVEDGEEFRTPPLDVLRYHRRGVRLHGIPWLGRAWSIVAVARQPMDLGLKIGGGYVALLDRLARAAEARFRPGRDGRWGTIGLTALVLTPEPIGPDEDAALQKLLTPVRRTRVVPLGLIRVNLGQEAMSLALTRPPGGLFPEPEALADALTPRLRRFVPLMEL
jgi:hypothetical protein